MAKRKLRKLSKSAIASGSESQQPSTDIGAEKPTSKTGAAKKWINDNPGVPGYAAIIAGVKSAYGFDLKNADVANAKTTLKTSGKVGRKRLTKARKPGAKVIVKATAIPSVTPSLASGSGDIVTATLKLVEAVGLEQARAIISGLAK